MVMITVSANDGLVKASIIRRNKDKCIADGIAILIVKLIRKLNINFGETDFDIDIRSLD